MLLFLWFEFCFNSLFNTRCYNVQHILKKRKTFNSILILYWTHILYIAHFITYLLRLTCTTIIQIQVTVYKTTTFYSSYLYFFFYFNLKSRIGRGIAFALLLPQLHELSITSSILRIVTWFITKGDKENSCDFEVILYSVLKYIFAKIKRFNLKLVTATLHVGIFVLELWTSVWHCLLEFLLLE